MRPPWKNESGSLALVAMAFSAVIAITLAGYIALSYQSYQHSSRLLQLTRTRRLAETGVEEALWALNNGDWSSQTWTVSGADIACTLPTVDLGEGAQGTVAVTIHNYASTIGPTIESAASVALLAGGQLVRTLTATTKPAPLFVNALGSAASGNGTITLASSTLVDSWNSNPLGDGSSFIPYSTPGSYNTAANCAAVVAAPNISMSSATIYGYAVTFGNSITSSFSAKVKGPTTPSSTRIDRTRVGKSAFVPMFAVAVPASYSVTGTLDGSNQTIGTANGATQYWSSPADLILNSTTLTVQGPVVIIIHGGLQLYNAGKIVVNATGKSRAEIFVSSDISIGINPHSSSAAINNLSNQPRNLALYSTSVSPSRQFNYYSTQAFCGVMYSAAPASVVFDTGTNNSITGAVLANENITVVSGSRPQFHYDTYLQKLDKSWFKGVTTPLLVVQVSES
ncbi:MAG TPA: hypothetical protein VGM73_14865 [Candidatus Didemnitutus sp.]